MDKTFSGLIAGISGAFLMNIWSYFSFYVLKFANLRFVDWASIMVFGYKTNSIGHLLVAQISQLVWSGFLGVIIAFLFIHINFQGHIIKGAFLGFIASFIIYCFPVIHDIDYLEDITLGTAVTDISGGVIWGITVAVILKYLDGNEIKKNNHP